ncbi:MAG TPA: DUF3800 domain-containing protein [Virgibacillus sp.]|nr:DUF3800 domain-containing protein [Virgibacillus sp.]
MDYFIYFDESNKLDDTKQYSYYGAYGGGEKEINKGVQSVKNILKIHRKQSEFHFAEYKNDKNLAPYLHLLHYIINSRVKINLFMVDNHEALTMAKQRNISTNALRKLFYVKIPERLFYGLTRQENFNYKNVKIFVDHSDEYGKFRLYSKLMHQMNAHSLYRGMNYQVKSVKPKRSERSIPLQIIDMFMGVVVFLIEKSYRDLGDKPIAKSDLIYRFLIEGENIQLFQTQVNIFKWNGQKESIKKVNLGDYLSEFMAFKTMFDIKEMTRLNKIMIQHPEYTGRKLREEMRYSNNRLKMLLGYKDEILGKGRNNFIMSKYYKLFSGQI